MIVKINGATLPSQAYEQTINAIRAQNPSMTDEDAHNYTMNSLVDQHLIKEEANDVFADIPAAELDEQLAQLKARYGGEAAFYEAHGLTSEHDENVKNDLGQQMKIDRFLNDLTKDVAAPTEDQLREIYDMDENVSLMPEERHIINLEYKFDPQDIQQAFGTMMDTRAKALAGADFTELACGISTCENPDLGFFPRGEMVEEFDTVAFSLNVDEISPIFLTQFGYHIIKCVGIKAEGKRTFDEIKERLHGMVFQNVRNQFVQQWLHEQKQSAEVEFAQPQQA